MGVFKVAECDLKARTTQEVLPLRAFTKLRRMPSSVEGLARKVNNLENKYDAQFRAVFDAIRTLIMAPDAKKERIGFRE
jgi:hypothetical protein